MNRTTIVVLLILSVVRSCPPAVAGSEAGLKSPLEPVYFRQIQIEGFWKTQFKRLTEKWIPHCVAQMEAGGEGQELLNLVHTAGALRGEPRGTFTGTPWSDAYIYNTMESICLALAIDPTGDQQLEKAQAHLRAKMEEWIPIILAAQCEDGYIHSYHIVNDYPRYSNINAHEFYVQGYFLEMGVAHFRITDGNDRRLYHAARRCADHLCDTFGPPPKRVWVHGHAGMGYALCRLARLVNQVEGNDEGDKYAQLAKFLLDTRHTVPEHRNAYRQSHRPVVEMTDAVGHAVRATYFYTAMADLAMLMHDEAYRAAVDRIWDNAIHRKHYITGGVGASHQGEAFSDDYDLRNDGYCESCAGCGLTFWADRMARIHRSAHFFDVQERTLYNNILGAIELSGENFYYQNPLASDRPRYAWHGCPCCVGNIPRALLGIKDTMYFVDSTDTHLFVNHFVAGSGTIHNVGSTNLGIRQQTEYPWQGNVRITLSPEEPARFSLHIRIPNRAESSLYTVTPDLTGKYSIRLNGAAQTLEAHEGYVTMDRVWHEGDVIDVDLPMDVQRVRCDERVRANRGRVALVRGPVTYNVESVDHDVDVRKIVLGPESPIVDFWMPGLLGGVMTIRGSASVIQEEQDREVRLLAVPNYVRLNRGGWSQVWITEDPEKTEELPADVPPAVKPIVRADLDERTLDRVVVGDANSERDHDFRGSRTQTGVFQQLRWRHAGNGWFSYKMEVDPKTSQILLCSYWGSDVGNRRFAILVNDREIAHQTLNNNRPGEFFDVEYPIPQELIRSKDKVTVKFQSDQGAMAGGIFDLRTLRASPPE